MNTEQLIRGNEIDKELDDLRVHKTRVENKLESTYSLAIVAEGKQTVLVSQLLPMGIENFMEDYLDNVDKRVAELKDEFTKL